MEIMSYPCSPLPSFPTHEESSYFIWSPQPQVVLHECATIIVDPSHDQQEDLPFLDAMTLDSNDLHHEYASDVGVFPNCGDSVWGQEIGNLVAIQDELMEENSLSDLLLSGAEAVEVGDSSLVSAVFSRLNGLLLGMPDNAAASSFDRLAYHFDQGLRSRFSSAFTGCYLPEPRPPGCMSVQQITQELSPFVKFAHFTANQAILDASTGETEIHVIDLNIGEGIQWPSLMSDLARHGGKSFRLTMITTDAEDDDNAPHTVNRLLSEFAESLNLLFQCNSLSLHNEEDLLNFSENCNGSVIISCDTTSMPYNSLSKLQMLLLGCVKKLQPRLVVLVEEELVRIKKEESLYNASFVEFFSEALHHFTTVFESLVSCFSGGNHDVCLRLVEREMVGPRIQDFVGHYGSVAVESSALEVFEGFRACELSCCNVAQARMLIGLFNRSFGVVHDKGRLALCWKSRPLTSVSVWAPVLS